MVEVLLVAADQHHRAEGRDELLRSEGLLDGGRAGVVASARLAFLRVFQSDPADGDACGARLLWHSRLRRARDARGLVGEMADHVTRGAFGAGGADDAVDHAIAERLHLARRLVGLHGEERLAGLHRLAFDDQPFDDLHVAAGRAKVGNDDRMLHDFAFPALPKRCMRRSTSRCMASRPGTRTSAFRPDPMIS